MLAVEETLEVEVVAVEFLALFLRLGLHVLEHLVHFFLALSDQKQPLLALLVQSLDLGLYLRGLLGELLPFQFFELEEVTLQLTEVVLHHGERSVKIGIHFL